MPNGKTGSIVPNKRKDGLPKQPEIIMKNTVRLLAAVLAALLLFSLASCGKTDTETLWKNAKYTADTTLGEGSKAVAFEVTAGDKTVRFTVHTDKENLGEALLDLGLIAGDTGEYGLYVKEVNGITADYDKDQSYWGFYVNGRMAMNGVDGEPVDETVTYAMIYTK